MSQLPPMIPAPMQLPPYGYVASSQGLTNLPNFGGIPVHPHNIQFPILPQVPQVVTLTEIIILMILCFVKNCVFICMLFYCFSITMECQLVIMEHLTLDCFKKSLKMVVRAVCYWKFNIFLILIIIGYLIMVLRLQYWCFRWKGYIGVVVPPTPSIRYLYGLLILWTFLFVCIILFN